MNDSACIRAIRVYVFINFQTMYLEMNLLSSQLKHAEAFFLPSNFAEAWQNIKIRGVHLISVYFKLTYLI